MAKQPRGPIGLRTKHVPAEKYAESVGDRMALHALPEELTIRLERLCDLNPTGANEVIKFAIDLYNEAYDDGRMSAEEAGSSYANGIKRGKQIEQERIRYDLSELLRKWQTLCSSSSQSRAKETAESHAVRSPRCRSIRS